MNNFSILSLLFFLIVACSSDLQRNRSDGQSTIERPTTGFDLEESLGLIEFYCRMEDDPRYDVVVQAESSEAAMNKCKNKCQGDFLSVGTEQIGYGIPRTLENCGKGSGSSTQNNHEQTMSCLDEGLHGGGTEIESPNKKHKFVITPEANLLRHTKGSDGYFISWSKSVDIYYTSGGYGSSGPLSGYGRGPSLKVTYGTPYLDIHSTLGIRKVRSYYSEKFFTLENPGEIVEPKLCLFDDGDIILVGESDNEPYRYSIIREKNIANLPNPNPTSSDNSRVFEGCLEAGDELDRDDILVSNNKEWAIKVGNNGVNYHRVINGEIQQPYEITNNGSGKIVVDSKGSFVLGNNGQKLFRFGTIDGDNPRLCVSDEADLMAYVDAKVGDRTYKKLIWQRYDFLGFNDLEDFDQTAVSSRYDNVDYTASNNQKNVLLRLVDFNSPAGKETAGVKYKYGSWPAPIVLAELYSARMLCFMLENEDFAYKIDEVYYNISPGKFELTSNGVVANMKIDSRSEECLLEIKPRFGNLPTTFRHKRLQIIGDQGQNLRFSSSEPLELVNQPIVNEIEEIKIKKPESLSSDIMTYEDTGKSFEKREKIDELIASECVTDSNSILCQKIGTMLLRMRGEGTTNLNIRYTNRCQPSQGAEIIDACFDGQESPNMQVLRPLMKKEEIAECQNEGDSDCIFTRSIYLNEYLGNQVDPLTLHDLKSMQVSFYKAPGGTVFVKNDCFIDYDLSTASSIKYRCQYNKDVSKAAAIKYAELTGGAKFNAAMKTVLIVIAVVIGIFVATLIPGAIAGLGYGFAALSANLLALGKVIGVALTTTGLISAPAMIATHVAELRECTGDVCELEQGTNTKRKMFIDTIKAPIFLYNFCYKLI